METTTPTTSKKPIYKKWWFWVIAVLIIAGIGAQRDKKKAAEPATAQSASTQATPAEEPAPPPAPTVTARALYSAYEANEVSADNSYKDKVFYVTGTVKDIGKDILNDAYLSLDVGELFGSVQCTFDDVQAVANIRTGQSVKVYGTGNGKTIGIVSVEDCKLVN